MWFSYIYLGTGIYVRLRLYCLIITYLDFENAWIQFITIKIFFLILKHLFFHLRENYCVILSTRKPYSYVPVPSAVWKETAPFFRISEHVYIPRALDFMPLKKIPLQIKAFPMKHLVNKPQVLILSLFGDRVSGMLPKYSRD